MFDVAIVGCGITGAATAFLLSQYDLNCIVLEKQNDIAMGATRANSAIIHAGYDPEPGTMMARLNVRGCEMAEKLCHDLDVPYKKIGSLVLAFSEEDMNTVRELYRRGTLNGVPDMKILTADEVHTLEPEVTDLVVGALLAPSAGIVSPWEYALAFAETAAMNGVTFRLNSGVSAIEPLRDGGWRLRTASGDVEARRIINAAGTSADMIHEEVAPKTFTVTPNRGEYWLLDKCESVHASHVLFQCPSKDGKGVLVSPTVHGNLIVGPNAESVPDGEANGNTAAGLAFVKERAALTTRAIRYGNSIRNFAGVRANTDQTDFVIGIAVPGFIDLAGIKSPGLSSAPAIAEEALKLLEQDGLKPVRKQNAVTTRKKLRFKELSDAEKQEAIRKNPLYGRVICRCETITEGEIVDAIHSPIPPVSVDGIKRRAGSGMGRCQGGFCGPRVLDILSREKGISPLEVLQDGEGSYILLSETKQGVTENV